MKRYFIRRLIQLIPLLIGISFIIFILLVLAPGNPVDMMIFGNPDVKPEDVVRLRKIYGLDDPIHIRYFKWLFNVLKGDLGYSQRWYRSNLDLIKIHLPRTLILSSVSLLISLIIAIPVGVYSAVRQYSFVDYLVTFLAFIGKSMPTFWFGIMMILFFSVYLKWLPPGGMSTIGMERNILDRAKYLIMPSLVLGLANITGWMRYMRSSLLKVIRQDYIRTARAKGLPERCYI
jgi:peptide/nickel transport system permease protein